MRFSNLGNSAESFEVATSNGLINAKLNSEHPEIVLEDNSILIFTNVETYYDFMTKADLFNYESKSVEIDNLLGGDFEFVIDTVSDFSYRGNDVNSIIDINYNDDHIYYIQRNGTNKINDF